MGQYAFNTKLPLPLATRYKLIYMPKQSQRILVSPLYNFPLHREAGNLNQAQTSAINCVCEFRFSSQNIFVLINENAAETVSYLFPATRCKLNQNLSLCFLIFCGVVLCCVEPRIKIQRCLSVCSVGKLNGSQAVEHNRVYL